MAIKSFNEWMNENNDMNLLLSIYERIGQAMGSKGIPLGTFDGNFLKLKAGLSDQEIQTAIQSGLLKRNPAKGGWEVDANMANQLGQQFKFNPNVPSWAK